MQTLTRVLNWADTSQDYGWELPPKFNRISKLVQRLELDNEQDIETPNYTIKELTVLWQLARPNERLLLALALNCGMGADQIGRLTMNRIHLHDDRPSYIKSRRYKKNVIGHWRLWGATKTLIRWAIETRPEAARDHNLLVVNSKGKSVYGKSKNGDRSRQIANAWYRLLDRAEKKKPGFRRLGFNSLRDTSAQFVRNAGGGELATIQLAHKHNTSDSQLGCYTNPNFKRLARCHSHLEAKRFAPLWEAVPDPTELPPRQNSRAFAKLAT